jgi:nheIR
LSDLIVHQVNIAHYRLIELTKLADQAKPFYDWVEKIAKRITWQGKDLNSILLDCSKDDIKQIILTCYEDGEKEKPLLFDGVGRVYDHSKACLYFFAWMIRDAPQQRLSPLIFRMQKADSVSKRIAEIDTLAELIYEYKSLVKSFDWLSVREVIIDRLEGSRRSISGHNIEANVRTSFVASIQYYYSIYGNYGKFNRVEFEDKQIKLGRHTVDVCAKLYPKNKGGKVESILIPVKTRETEGGGHSHLFTRDIITAITDIKKEVENPHIMAVIIAENWSPIELVAIDNLIDIIFHFNMSPNNFFGFDDKSQVRLNKYIESIFRPKGKTL